ncbi:unnamed protein product [Toxocara canis]|uniref:Uncharacterized protein n=1 Tax=Toxocara canis TaxID=6265 RepID=A0A183UQE5_TOXCA|nr:unnamed protein product [Toxocara canis]
MLTKRRRSQRKAFKTYAQVLTTARRSERIRDTESEKASASARANVLVIWGRDEEVWISCDFTWIVEFLTEILVEAHKTDCRRKRGHKRL